MEKEQKIDSIVVDTGAIFALADRTDAWHRRCSRFVSGYRGRFIVPCTVIPEVSYLLNAYLGQFAERVFVESLLRKELSIDHFQPEDLERSHELLKRYSDLNLGLVDASIVSICERRRIFDILTTDRRHFSVVKSEQGKHFHLWP
ncbi:MAG TPA: PIN domain-containing protein [Candidatus Hodarchaeales archaeon]|nr:PIN domain-containing protein [Candidatus Hodarchaeales archaeon]